MNDLSVLEKLSNLTFCGFYDSSKQIITIHFFNKDCEKPDIMAYLNKDMSWDVREVLEENSILYKDCEIITITHKVLSREEKDSVFDKFVRKGLISMAEQTYGKDANLIEKDKIFEVLFNNTYGS